MQVGADYEAYLPKMEGNTYIQGYKNTLAVFGKDSGKTYYTNASSRVTVKNEFGDETGEVYIVESIPYYSFAEAYKSFKF